MKRFMNKLMLTLVCLILLPTLHANAETMEEKINNLIGPQKTYDTHLSPVYLKHNTTEENISPRNGSLKITQTDYTLPGINGLDLEIKRIYSNSTTNISQMKVKYVNGAWVDYIENEPDDITFYEKAYNLGIGTRFTFPMLEIKENADNTNYIFLHSETGDVYTLKKYNLDEYAKEEWFNNDYKALLSNVDEIYLPEEQTVKDVFVGFSSSFSNGQSDGTSYYVMVEKDGKRTFFAEDGRILGIQDRYGNTITFKYTTIKTTIDGTEVEKKLISEIIDTLNRSITITYKQDNDYRVQAINDDREDISYNETQNPNTTKSGDLNGNFQVIINLPTGENITYDKSAALVTDQGQVVRTRIQTVYDMDGQAKYHYWYEQPSLGFTYMNGTNYSVYNRYENLVQIDYCKTNQIRRYQYDTYTETLHEGSQQYRKVTKRQLLEKTGYSTLEKDFLDRFSYKVIEQENYSYTNEPDGFGYDGYDVNNWPYLKDTYRYYTQIEDLTGNQVIKTYDGLHQLLQTELIGEDHKEIIRTEHDDYKLINLKEITTYQLIDGQVSGEPIISTEHFAYDKYGNLINYTDIDGHMTTYAYDYDRYHQMTLKTWNTDKDTTTQLIHELDDLGNVITRSQSMTDGKVKISYDYDDYGNLIKKTEHGTKDYITEYEYPNKAYLSKTITTVDGNQLAKEYLYDDRGNLKEVIDEKGNSTKYKYDVLNRLETVTYDDGTTEHYNYSESPFSNLEVTYTDRKNYQYKYIYNVQGKQLESSKYVEEDDQWLTLLTSQYDTYGQLIEEIDAKGNKTTYTYNSNKQLIQKQYYDGSVQKDTIQLNYYINYEDYPYVTELIDEDGYKTYFYYDKKGQLARIAYTPDNKTYYSETYTYDYVGHRITSTNAKGNTTTYTYDKASRLVSQKDPLGNITTYTYDGANQLTQINQPDGRVVAYQYDERKLVTVEEVYLTNKPTEVYYTTYAYDDTGLLTTKEKGKEVSSSKTLSQKTTYAYDNMNRLVDEYRWIDGTAKNHIQYDYDANGNQISKKNYANESETSYILETNSYGLEDVLLENTISFIDEGVEQDQLITKYEYDFNNNIIKQHQLTDDGYVSQTYSYDYKDRLVQTQQPVDSNNTLITDYQYDNRGNQISVTYTDSDESNKTIFKYDGLNRQTKKINPLGYTTTYVYDENGNIIKEIDARYANMDVTTAPGILFEYDANNRLKKRIYFDGTTEEVMEYFAYDGRGNLVLQANNQGYNSNYEEQSIGSQYTYNAINQVEQKQTAETVRKNLDGKYTYSYDGSGRVIQEVNPYNDTTIYKYDQIGQLTSVQYPDGTTESMAYDITGKLYTEKTNQKGYKTKNYFNLLGLPIKQEYHDGTSTTYNYSIDGKLIDLYHSSGSHSSYDYDLIGNIIEERVLVREESLDEVYRATTNTYNINNQILRTEIREIKVNKSTGEETLGELASYIENTYDQAGRRTQTLTPDDRVSIYEYDEIGNVITTKVKVDDNQWQINRFEYNLLGLPIKKILLVSSKDIDVNALTNAAFDSQYPTMVQSITEFTNDVNGNIKTITDQLGHVSSFEYDLEGKVITKTDPRSNNTEFTYDMLGYLIQQKNPLDAITTYEYDAMSRLVRKTVPHGDNDDATYRYIYDEVGNLVKSIEPKQYNSTLDQNDQAASMKGTTYTYDNMNRMIEVISPDGDILKRMTYDDKGRIIKQVDGLHLSEDKGYTYIYDELGSLLETTDPLGNTTSYAYDILGNRIEMEDAKGNITSYFYNNDNTLKEVTYADGKSTSYTYDKLGQLTTQTDQLGNKTSYTYNAFGQMTEQTDALNNSIQYQYDIKGQVTEITDQVGSTTYFIYDSQGRLLTKETPVGKSGSKTVYKVENYVYDEVGNVLSVSTYEKDIGEDLRSVMYTYYPNNKVKTQVYSHGETTTFTYDKNGNVIKQQVEYPNDEDVIREYTYDINNNMTKDILTIDTEGLDSSNLNQSINQFSYDILGNLKEHLRPKAFYYQEEDAERENYKITYTYDVLNRMVTTTYKNNNQLVSKQYSYDELGNQISETNENGDTITYEYDNMNRLVKTTDLMGESFINTYDEAGRLISVTNPLGQTMTYVYDDLHRVIQIIDDYDEVISQKTYDAKGNQLTETDANGYTTTYTYDEANRLLTVTDPETTDSNEAFTIKYTYNIYNQVLSQENALGEEIQYSYDNRGLLTQVIDPLGIATSYTYNDKGNKLSKVDGQGRQTTYSYNANGLMTKVTNPLDQSIHYTYDINGQVVEEIKKDGQTISYSYDNLGRLLTKVNKDTNQTIQYTYDVLGNRKSMVDATGTTAYTYNKNNQLLTKSKDGNTQIAYQYDELGNMITMSAVGKTVQYTYDRSNRMESVHYGDNITTYTYDKAGNRKSIQYQNGVTITYSYDKNNQVIGITNKKGISTLSSLNYVYDLAGRQIQKENHMGITNYIYDKAGRLKKEEAPGYTVTYSYDLVGNRTSKTSVYNNEQSTSFVNIDTNEVAKYTAKKTYYIYNNVDQLLYTTEKMLDTDGVEILQRKTTYTYDANGNQTSEVSSYTHPHNLNKKQKIQGESAKEDTESINNLIDRVKYQYDGFNQLISVERIKDSERNVVTYTYDGDGLRTQKIEKTSSNNYLATTTTYTYDRQHVILEKDQNNQETFYLRGINYIAKETDSLSYYLYNGHGDVIQTVDESGNIKNQYVYDAFGNETFTHELEENAIRYSGEFFDASTGLYYLRARYYNPNIGRFISEDSYWGEDTNPASLNLYVYCYNNPIQFVDPTGHWGGVEGEQDDSKLSVEDQRLVKQITDAWFTTDNKGIQDALHRMAEDVRNKANNSYLKGNETDSGKVISGKDYNDGFTSAIDDIMSTKKEGETYLSKEEWEETSKAHHRKSGGKRELDQSTNNEVNKLNLRFGDEEELKLEETQRVMQSEYKKMQEGSKYSDYKEGSISHLLEQGNEFMQPEYYKNREKSKDSEGIGYIKIDPTDIVEQTFSGTWEEIKGNLNSATEGISILLFPDEGPLEYFEEMAGVQIVDTPYEIAEEMGVIDRMVIFEGATTIDEELMKDVQEFLEDPNHCNDMSYEEVMAHANEMNGRITYYFIEFVITEGLLKTASKVDDANDAIDYTGGMDDLNNWSDEAFDVVEEASQSVRYSPANPGPLSQEVAETFSGASYTETILTEDTVFYRVYGGDAGEVGRYMTRVPQNGGMQSQIDLALNPEWGNTAEYVTEVVVPKGTVIYEGTAASQTINGGAGQLLGGGNQIYIPEVNSSWFGN